jgi:hypothetical protein
MTIGVEKRFLPHILRVFPLREHPVSHAKDAFAIPAYQRIKRLGLALLRHGDELLIRTLEHLHQSVPLRCYPNPA